MRAEPWEPGSLPVDCPTCGVVQWAKAPFSDLECCGARLRFGGSDSKPHVWYVGLCETIRENYRARVAQAIKEIQ